MVKDGLDNDKRWKKEASENNIIALQNKLKQLEEEKESNDRLEDTVKELKNKQKEDIETLKKDIKNAKLKDKNLLKEIK